MNTGINKHKRRIGDYGVIIGNLPRGARNAVTDVPGVMVGHVTLDKGPAKTGVTALLPHGGNLFRSKTRAACHVINGFGKTAGLVQVEELGTLETPILLTNTLSVGAVWEGVCRYMLDGNPDIGRTTGTVNPVVCECNDGYLNDIRAGLVKSEHAIQAIAAASADFAEGAVGAGTGMSCYGLKGGIGSASRILNFSGKEYTVGVLVLTNFGLLPDLSIGGVKAGQLIDKARQKAVSGTPPESGHLAAPDQDKGSIIVIAATDLPVNERQLKRMAKRTAAGIARTGSFGGNGSGDIALAFSTCQPVDHYEEKDVTVTRVMNENRMDAIFRAVVEGTEEAILNSLVCADTVVGRNGNSRYSLRHYLEGKDGVGPIRF